MTDNPSAILEATESFVCEIEGERFTVHAGTTRVAAAHTLAKHHPARFRPVEDGLSYPVEEAATANPGEQRTKPAPAKATASSK